MTGGAGAGVGAAGCTGVVGAVGSRGEFRTFSRKVVKTGSTGVGVTTGGATGASCERHRLSSRRIYDNRSRGRACVGSFAVSGEVLYREIRNRGKGPPLAVADEGVVERVLPVV